MKQITESYLRKIIQEEAKKIFEQGGMAALRQRAAQDKPASAGSKVAAAAGGAKKYAAGAAKAAAGSLGVPVAKAVGKGIMKDVGALFSPTAKKGEETPGEGEDFAGAATAGAKGAAGAKSDVQRAVKFMTVNKQLAPLVKNIAKDPTQSAIFISQVMNWLGVDQGDLSKVMGKVKSQMARDVPAAPKPEPGAAPEAVAEQVTLKPRKRNKKDELERV